MNWDAVAAVAELIGVLAVVASLLYLAKQVKDANILNRTNTYREIQRGITAQANITFAPENSKLILKGFKDFELLKPEEKISFEHLLGNIFQYAEDSWNSARVNLLRSESVETWSWYLRNRIFPHKGARQWWDTMKFDYGSDFREWIDSIVDSSDPDADPYNLRDSH